MAAQVAVEKKVEHQSIFLTTTKKIILQFFNGNLFVGKHTKGSRYFHCFTDNTASIQIAKLAGASVYVVGSTPEKLALAASLGADVLIDSSAEPDWSKTVYKLTARRGVDLVVDNVGTTFPLSFRAARKGGRILTVGNTGGPKFEIDNRLIFGKHLTIIGSTMGTRTDFAAVMHLVFAGKLTVALDQAFPLEDAAAAHRRLESGRQMGKITLKIAAA